MKTVSLGSRKIVFSKIICIGRNYVEHIAELGNEIPEDMVVFLKPNSAITDTLVSFHQEELFYECELCFLYENRRFSAAAAGLDLTKRGLQSKLKSKGLSWERAKAFDGSVLFSSFAEIPENAENFSFTLEINGKLIQTGNDSFMIYKPQEILKELLSFMTLADGDIVMTGTPKGVGVVHKGDVLKAVVSLEGKLLSSKEWKAQ